MTKFYKKNNKENGFTLIEVIVAIFVFSVAVLAVMASLSQGLSSESYTKKKVTATFLAQEGVEYFRNIRDTSMLYSDDKVVGWSDFISKLEEAGCQNDTGCYFDDINLNSIGSITMPIMQIKISPCNEVCPNMLFDESSSTFGYTLGGDSGFVRQMKVEETSLEEVKIISKVSWTQNGRTNTVSFSENLSDWIE
ncbi:MAG TPA: prepilin-type N-terminal cleavage/methylation domain-containing protein [Candidatus Paceibacterota bacterium]|nr:prepilin-type N-terminal cleavage/methylation domain-containing protein [Candidatus Paceibacterota bacterium]HPT18227.1 prepilin-type N-terminal cleavage/methylation domain-containing protein [Candidatus Paceibacterota bacterium]